MKVHLIDGTYELFRAYYGGPSLESPAGDEVGATRTWMSSLYKLLRQGDVTHVGCAFDHTVESFRNALFDGYKTGDGIDPDLFAQFPLAERAARALGVVVWPMIEFEADDGLATAAARYARSKRVEQVVICTPDKDLLQCVRDGRVVGWDRLRDTWYDDGGVRAKMGVGPESVPDYLALVGDSADGIPGIPRWGAKSAAAVLNAYPHLEAIPDDPEDWSVNVRGAKTLAENLRTHRDEAALYKQLATLRTDAPVVKERVDALRWRGADRDALTSLCEEIGFERFVERVDRWR